MADKKITNKYTKVFETADSISIAFNYTDSADVFRVSAVHKTERGLMEAIGDIFNKKEDICKSKTNGSIWVFSKDSIVLDIGIGERLDFLTIKEDSSLACYRLSSGLSKNLGEYRELMK